MCERGVVVLVGARLCLGSSTQGAGADTFGGRGWWGTDPGTAQGGRSSRQPHSHSAVDTISQTSASQEEMSAVGVAR